MPWQIYRGSTMHQRSTCSRLQALLFFVRYITANSCPMLHPPRPYPSDLPLHLRPASLWLATLSEIIPSSARVSVPGEPAECFLVHLLEALSAIYDLLPRREVISRVLQDAGSSMASHLEMQVTLWSSHPTVAERCNGRDNTRERCRILQDMAARLAHCHPSPILTFNKPSSRGDVYCPPLHLQRRHLGLGNKASSAGRNPDRLCGVNDSVV
jgi:hypothetical protein